MRYEELLENNHNTENDESDEDLFGSSSPTLGLTPQQCNSIAQVLVGCRKLFEHDPEFEDLQEDDPQEWHDIRRDFNRAIVAFNRNDPLMGLAALQTNPINYDLDDWAMQVIANKTNIKLWDIVDMDDPAQEAAFNRAQRYLRAANTRYDSMVGESDDATDDELFGRAPRISPSAREELIAVLRGHSPDDGYELWDTLKDLAREFKNTPTGKEFKAILRGHSPDDGYELWDTLLDLAGVTDDDLEFDDDLDENNEPGDDELFGDTPTLSGAKRLIHTAGRRILNSLQQAWNDPAVQQEYKEYEEAGDVDAMFDQVVRICKLPFKQVYVVDSVMREFTAQEGLNDYGRMLESGEFPDLTDAWKRFAEDEDIEHEEWFQKDARDFTGGL